jgi:hypothetical protein
VHHEELLTSDGCSLEHADRGIALAEEMVIDISVTNTWK